MNRLLALALILASAPALAQWGYNSGGNAVPAPQLSDEFRKEIADRVAANIKRMEAEDSLCKPCCDGGSITYCPTDGKVAR